MSGRRALVLEAHHTTHIEGTELTLAQAERLFAGDSVPNADPGDVRELLSFREAAPGEYRKKQKYVVNASTGRTIYRPPAASEVDALMRSTRWATAALVDQYQHAFIGAKSNTVLVPG